MRLKVDVGKGKYTIIQKDDGGLDMLRYGEPWIEGFHAPGAKLILVMAQEIEGLREFQEAMRERFNAKDRETARLLKNQDRLVEALAYALNYYIPSISAEAEVVAFLNGYDGRENIMEETGLMEAIRPDPSQNGGTSEEAVDF